MGPFNVSSNSSYNIISSRNYIFHTFLKFLYLQLQSLVTSFLPYKMETLFEQKDLVFTKPQIENVKASSLVILLFTILNLPCSSQSNTVEDLYPNTDADK